MTKKIIIPLLCLIIGFILGVSYNFILQNYKMNNYTGYSYEYKYKYESKLSDFAKTNYNIYNSIILGFYRPALGPDGIDHRKSNVDNSILSLQTLTGEMEKMPVPERYKQAHKELLSAYQDFLNALIVYQKSYQEDDSSDLNIEKIHSGYLKITQASDKWYTIYQDHMGLQGKINNDKFAVIGTKQQQIMYIKSTKLRVESTFDNIETNIFPFFVKKNYDGVEKMQHNTRNKLPGIISYLKNVNVPEPFAAEHKHLLSSNENFYNLINNTPYEAINEEYQEKFIECYLDMKKAFKEWNVVLDRSM